MPVTYSNIRRDRMTNLGGIPIVCWFPYIRADADYPGFRECRRSGKDLRLLMVSAD